MFKPWRAVLWPLAGPPREVTSTFADDRLLFLDGSWYLFIGRSIFQVVP